MNRLLALAVGLVAVGVLIGMGVLQAAPTPDSFKAYWLGGAGTGWTDTWPKTGGNYVTTASGNVTGVSMELKLPGTRDGGSTGSYTFSWVESCAIGGTGTGTVGVGQSTVTLTETLTWATFPSSSGSYVPTGTACWVYVKIVSGGPYTPRWIIEDGRTGLNTIVLWEKAYTPPAGPPPSPLPPNTPPIPTPPLTDTTQPPPPPSEGIPSWFFVVLVVVFGVFALILIRR